MAKSIFSQGRPNLPGSPQTTSVLRYLPRSRNPARPHSFSRQNMMKEDLDKMWARGRYQTSTTNWRSPYFTAGSTTKFEEETVSITPRKQLEKFMPNIDIGPGAYVTPVSLMSARSGHRVTHDLMHSYDPYVGGKAGNGLASVGHDNISIHDPSRVGLHPDAVASRAAMFRWLRRSPFFQENHYFNRSAVDPRTGNPIVAAVEQPLHEKIIRLAGRGHLKAACEEYRRLAFVPPVEVYRALTKACIPGAKLADAVEIFEEGHARLRYVGRDFEVFRNVLRCCIAADSPERVMWLVNKTEGTWTENNIVRVRFSALERYDLYATALEFLLDRGADELSLSACATTSERAQELYSLMAREKLLSCDLQIAEGQRLQKLLLLPQSESESIIGVPTEKALSAHPLQVAARGALDLVGARWIKDWQHQLEENAFGAASAGERLQKAVSACAATDDGVRLDLLFLVRHCRFRGDRDLLTTGAAADKEAFERRALRWIQQLSGGFVAFGDSVGQPLPYLPKSRPSHAVNGGEFTRVVIPPAEVRSYSGGRANTKSDNVARFYFKPGTRFVSETWPTLDGDTGAGKYLTRVPLHKEHKLQLHGAAYYSPLSSSSSSSSSSGAPPLSILHSSISPENASRAVLMASSSSPGSSSSASGRIPSSSSSPGVNGRGGTSSAAKLDPSMESSF